LTSAGAARRRVERGRLMSDAGVVRAALEDAAALCRQVAAERSDIIVRAAEIVRDAIAHGRKVLVFGNGGSATDAQHFAAELVGRFTKERRAMAATALTADTAILTSVANDYGFAEVFARQIDALGREGDVAIGITTSGESASVNAAIERAKAGRLVTIGLTGRDGGQTGRLVDVHVNVPGSNTARIQEVHRAVLHVMCELIEA